MSVIKTYTFQQWLAALTVTGLLPVQGQLQLVLPSGSGWGVLWMLIRQAIIAQGQQQNIVICDARELVPAELEARLAWSLFGESKTFVVVAEVEGVVKPISSKILEVCTAYTGTHHLIIVSPSKVSGIASEVVVPEKVDQRTFMELCGLSGMAASASAQLQAHLPSLSLIQRDMSIEQACVLAMYLPVVGRSVDPDEFWIKWWSDTFWNAYRVLLVAPHNSELAASQYSKYLPFSFVRGGWRKHTVDSCAQAIQLLAEFDRRLKNGYYAVPFELLWQQWITSEAQRL